MTSSSNTTWERWSETLVDGLPYLTLTISTIVSLFQPEQTVLARVETTAWAALAATWVFFMYTRTPTPRHLHSTRMRVYFGGLLACAAVLLVRQPIFFVFTVTGFFHASLLRPWPLLVLGIAATSMLLNTIITGFPWPTIEGWSIYVAIIVMQTLSIAFGTTLSVKLSEVSEQRRHLVRTLEAALEENAGLHAQLLTQAREAGVLDERQRMAREIHDTLAQGLTGIITQLEAVEQARDRPTDWQRHLGNAARLARESLAEARRSVAASRPEALERARLPEALAELAQHWSSMHGVPVDVTTIGEVLPLHPEIEVALLRTTQEALTNVVKHAHASRAGVTLSYMGDVVTLDVRDDGIGFVAHSGADRQAGGFGLTAMRQRVTRVAGALAIESEPGVGTVISVRVPSIVAHQEAIEV